MIDTAHFNPSKQVAEVVNPTVYEFQEEIYPAGRPVVMRGVARDWGLVEASGQSTEALAKYIRSFDRGAEVDVLHAPSETGGKFFYSDDMQGFSFARNKMTLSDTIDALIASGSSDRPESIYIEATPVGQILSDLAKTNWLQHAPPSVEPRIWIGNATTVQTHFDLSQNIACVASGRRRFTLFPPEQTPNLYMGPMERTPSGTPISMVDLDDVDYDKYPRFKEAEQYALMADLEPGDAIFIPYMWWHHVQSFGNLNVLINYWWNEYDDFGSPMYAMLHSVLTVRDMPPAMRSAWKAMFDHFVFDEGAKAMDHMPMQMRGGLGPVSPQMRQGLWHGVAQGVAPHVAPPTGTKPK